jgi:hypothetical protein
MNDYMTESPGLDNSWLLVSGGACVGRIVHVSAEGKPSVDFPGNPAGPVEARSVVRISSETDVGQLAGSNVLLVFENNNAALPIVAGLLSDTLYSAGPVEAAGEPAQRPASAVVDGQRVVIEGREEIQLRCGKSSITLKKDGKVLVKGTQLVSRASGTNKIKGASVAIN